MKTVKIEISKQSFITILGIMVGVWILYVSKEVLLFLFASFIIASALFPTVDGLSKKMPRPIAVGIIYLAGFIIISTLLAPFFTILIDQTQEFLLQLPKYYKVLQKEFISWHGSNDYLSVLPSNKDLVASVTQYGENILSGSINITINLFATIVAVFTLATIVLFILLDKESLKKGFLYFFPSHLREKAETITATISKKVGGYVRGQLFVMFAVGLVTGIALTILGIPFAFLLGMVAGILEIVPIIGPILAAVPAILLALAINPWLALAVIGVYLVIQRIENFISPLIYGKFLDLPPLVIISALLIAASTLGITGVILSPAIAAALYVLIQELYLKKINPDMA